MIKVNLYELSVFYQIKSIMSTRMMALVIDLTIFFLLMRQKILGIDSAMIILFVRLFYSKSFLFLFHAFLVILSHLVNQFFEEIVHAFS